jgi:ABC-2 type transport system permease protein
MQLFFRELKSYRKSTAIWTLSLCTMTVLILLMFPAFTKDIAASQRILENLPAALRDALGLSLQYFFTVYGFYSYMLTFIVLAAAVQATSLGVGIISKEISGKTADFLLTRPISRIDVITSKLAAALCLVILTNVVLLTVSLITAQRVAPNGFNGTTFTLLVSSVFFVQLAFLSLGFLLGVLLPKVKSVISVSLPTVFTLFIIGTLGAILGNTIVRYITAFKFFDTTYIMSHNSYEPAFVVLEVLYVAVAITATYVIFMKKDIRVT